MTFKSESILKKLLHYIKPHAGMMTVGFVIKVIGTFMDLFLPWILSYLIDDVVPAYENTVSKESVSAILIWGGVMIVCSVFAVVFSIKANQMASKVAGECVRDIRHDLYSKISYLDSSKIDHFTISSLELRLTSDTYYVHQMIGMMQRLGVRAPILLIGGIVVSFILDVRLTLIMICALPFIGAAIYFFSKRGIPLYTSFQQSIDKLTSVVRENASGIRIIKALRKTDHEKERFDAANKEAIGREKKAGITMAATNPLVTLFLNIGLSAVILIGAYLVSGGKSSAGKIIAFMSYFAIISNAMLNLSRMFVMISKGSAGMNRIAVVLDARSDLTVPDDSDYSDKPENGTPHIRFKDVNFSYPGKSHVLSGIDFSLEHGQTLGIVGATGSGKSSIVSLLLRTYDPDSGTIYIDGKDIKKIPTSKLRKRFGVVFQNDFLLSDTIRENVSFCRELDNEKLIESLRDAQAYEFVDRYDDKLMHELEIKGANLSGGQKQRLLIARALAGDPEILILDDSSSALDFKTDAALRKVINEKYGKVTKIIVAQRISSIMHSDRIIVLEGGRIIGNGTHSELMKNCELYRETAKLQIGGIADDI